MKTTKKLKCPRCASNKTVLMDGEEHYLCNKCKQFFKPEEKIQPVEPPKPAFLCKVCQKPFENEKKLRRHFGMVHYDILKM